MALPKPIANFETYLTGRMTTSDTSFTINDVVDEAGNSLDALDVYIVIDDGETNAERIRGTITAATKTVDTSATNGLRGIDPSTPTTSVTALKFAHDKGASVKITDAHYLLDVINVLNGTVEAGGNIKAPSSRTFTDARHYVDKEYADALTVATFNDFAVTDAGGLDIDIAAGYVVAADGTVEFAGGSSVTMTDDTTNYIEIDTAGVYAVNTTGWTLGFAPLAKVLTASGDISTITLARGLVTLPETDSVVSTDLTYGETIAAGEAVYQKSSDGKLYLTVTGTQSQGTLTFAANAQNNETVVLGAQTYTWKTTLTGAADEVKIGVTAEDSLDNLVAAINDAGVEGTNYGTGTTANASATAVKDSSTTLIATAITPGTAGDSIASTETMTDGSWDAATLGTTTAGVDGGEVSDAFYGIALDAGVADDTGKRIQVRGLVEVLSGLTIGAQYLSDTDGAITNTAPSSYKRRVGYAIATTKMLIDPSQSPADLSGANSDTTIANFREAMAFFGNTGMTGAEAETLTDGSDASSLHHHKHIETVKHEFATGTHLTFNIGPIDGTNTLWTENVTSGNVIESIMHAHIETSNSSGGDAFVTYKDLYSSGNVSPTPQTGFDSDVEFIFFARLGTTTNQDIVMGLHASTFTSAPVDSVHTGKHVSFFVEDGTLKASIADGTTQETENITATLTDWNYYRIVFTAGSDVKFYVNDTLESTLSTNVPSGAATDYRVNFGVTTVENDYKGFQVANNIILRVEI